MRGNDHQAESRSGARLASIESAQENLGKSLPPGYIHLGVAKEIVPVLQSFGLDPNPIVKEAGLDPALFDDVTSVIAHAALGRLLTLCVERTYCPHFGLMVGQRATILSLGLVGRLMQHCETIGDALRSLVSNLVIQNRGAVPSLSICADFAQFTFSIYQPEIESVDQILDGALAVAVNAIRSIHGADWNPSEVLLPHKHPRDIAPYRRHFRAPVRFDQENATLSMSACDLERRISGADPILRAVLEEHIHQLKGQSGAEFSDDIRRLLRARLTTNRCSAEDIAVLLTMHRRTLSRRLRACGIGYRKIANETRFEVARQLLEDTHMPLGQIAAALGYSEASAFTRAFRRWSGLPPTIWRADERLH